MYAEIQKQTDKHSVSELCEIYGVSRSGYYKWLKRAGRLNRYEKTHKTLDSYVLDIHSHHPMMGYRKHNSKWYYLAGYLDLFNNEIVEWELSDTFDNFLVMKPAERLLKRKMSTEHQVLLHSDQGVQYSSADYCNLLKDTM